MKLYLPGSAQLHINVHISGAYGVIEQTKLLIKNIIGQISVILNIKHI